MELAVVAGIGLIGSYIANNKNDINSDPINSDNKIYKKRQNVNEELSKFAKKTLMVESNEIDHSINNTNGFSNPNRVKMFPSEINGKVHHVYDTRITPQIQNNYYDLAKDVREKSKIPERTNIIPPFYNQPYVNKLMSESDKLTMGPVPNSELLKQTESESFVNQFNLQTADNQGTPASMGDTWNSSHRENILSLERNLATSQGFSPFDNSVESDMTYGICPKEHFVHNNMQPNTKRRDYETNESNNFEYKMEIFAGSSKNWNPKRETVPFFDPEHYKQLPFGQELLTQEQRDRTYVSLTKNGERPFEPIQVAPGLNLDYNQEPSSGRHDTFRVMPKDTNELRPQNKPKITYDGKIAAGPKKGQKRGVTAPVIKRRPEQWRYKTVDDLVPTQAVVKGPTNPGNFVIPDNARQATTSQLMGPVNAPKQVGGDERAGLVKVSKRVTHVEDKLGPKNPVGQFNPNDKSFNVPLNERNTTNYDDVGHAKGAHGNTKTIDFNDIAKQTIKQTLTNSEFNTNTKSAQGLTKAIDHNDIAKQTTRQTLTNAEFNTNTKSAQGLTKAIDHNDITKQTTRQTLTNAEFNTNTKSAQGLTKVYDEKDIAKQTGRQTLASSEFNTNNKPAQRFIKAYDEKDIAKQTMKQTLTSSEFNTNTGANQKEVYANFTDIAKNTNKQTLTNSEFNTNAGPNQGFIKAYDDKDVAKNTMRQTLTENEFNTNAGPNQKETYVNLTDITRTTGKQTLTEKEFNTNAGPNQGFIKAYDEKDVAKNTMRQTLTEKQFNTVVAKLVGSYTELTDQARNTIKQLLTTTEFNTNAKAAHKEAYANLTDEAKTTIKQILALAQLNNNAKPAQKEVYANLTDITRTTVKQILSVLELNNNAKPAQKEAYANLTDIAKNTTRQTLTDAEFSTFVKRTMSTYANLSDEAKQTLKQILAVEPLNNMIGAAQKNSYANLTDEARQTLKELLTLQTFSTHIKQNPGSYANLQDEARQTLKQIIATVELNNNMKSTQKGTYTELMDLAKQTIKEFIAVSELNNNIKSNQKSTYANLQDEVRTTGKQNLDVQTFNTNVASALKQVIKVDFNDLARTTHKQDLLNEDYLGAMHNSGIGTQQVDFLMPMTMKDLNKAIDYVSSAYAAGSNKNDRSQMAERNMRQNVTKEIIAQGVAPTLSGPKLIPTKDYYMSMQQRDKPNFSRAQPPVIRNKINLEDRDMFRAQEVKTQPFYDERLYDELLSQLDDNPLNNNIQSTVKSRVGEPLRR
jgi:hypothetical protein